MSHLGDRSAEELLDQTQIKNITTTRNLVTLNVDDSIEMAMQKLSQFGITSAPIIDPKDKMYVGFVDVLDLAVFVSYVFHENFTKHPHLYDPKELRKRFSLPVRELINASKRDPFWTIDSGESVAYLINNFLKVGIHRVPVSENGEVVGVVSQSDVVRFLYKNFSKIATTANKTIKELGLDKGYVVAVKNDATLMEAINTIVTNSVTGVAIVDFSTGALINNLSASDLKGLTEQSFFRLEPPVSCFPNDRLNDVLSEIEKTGVHRVYVVDQDNRPTSVITLTDILSLFARPGNPLDI